GRRLLLARHHPRGTRGSGPSLLLALARESIVRRALSVRAGRGIRLGGPPTRRRSRRFVSVPGSLTFACHATCSLLIQVVPGRSLESNGIRTGVPSRVRAGPVWLGLPPGLGRLGHLLQGLAAEPLVAALHGQV